MVGAGTLVLFWFTASVWVAPVSNIVEDSLAAYSLVTQQPQMDPKFIQAILELDRLEVRGRGDGPDGRH